jgi:exodeoxyribonuclease VII small subunit
VNASPEPRPEIAVSELTYTQASRELEEIVSFFEQRDVDVDQLVARLERATAIVDELDRRIRRTRAQVEQLVPRLEAVAQSAQGVEVTRSLEGGDEDGEQDESVDEVSVDETFGSRPGEAGGSHEYDEDENDEGEDEQALF